MRFHRGTSVIALVSFFFKPHVSVLRPSTSGSPANRTQHDPVISRIQATSLRLPVQSGISESNREPPAPKAGVLPSAPLPECFQSERQDSNQHSLGPQPSAISLALPRSDVRRAPRAQVGWEVLEPSSAAFQATAKPSQLPARQPVVIPPPRSAASAVPSPTQQKNPVSCDTGFCVGEPQGLTGVTGVTNARADYSPGSW
jgi:hypothetical protein